MKKEIYINESMGETRIAILEDDRLVELYLEKHDQHRMVGNIYKGKVENVIPGMQAAFVDIGYDINAFLPFSEIHNGDYLLEEVESSNGKNSASKKKSNQNGNISVDLQTDQDIFVQVIKEPFASKGPRVTTEVAIPGRLLVLVPGTNYVGISKKIWDKYERRRLKKIIISLKEKGFGIIIRTVAESKSEDTIRNDYKMLMKHWFKMDQKSKKAQAPALVYQDLETASSIIRDLLTPDIEKIIIDSKKLFRKLQSYLDDVSPNLSKLLRPKVWLKSGAYLIIEKTEAMVVVDVNSGRFIGKDLHEANSYKINIEAAREVARQLRLRDLSGLIVIDFIDMQKEENRRNVYYELRKELKKDRAKVAVSPISDFGLLEMTRQRIRLSILETMSEDCPTCKGSGRIISKDTLITRIDHWLRRYKSKKQSFRLQLHLHPENYHYFKDQKKKALRGLMWQNFVHLKTKEDAKISRDEFRFYSVKDGIDITDKLPLGN